MSQREIIRIESRLRELDQQLFGQYLAVRGIVEELMARAYATFWNYTDHSLTHTSRVVELVDRLLTAEVLASLRADEIFTLLCGGLLHDVGMTTSRPLGEEAAEAARRGHDVVGAAMVTEHPERYGIPERFASSVAKVIRHHRASDIAKEVADQAVGFDMVRLRLLCALVRAADELHITDDRAPMAVLATLDLPEDSVRHFAHCAAVKGVALRAGTAQFCVTAVVKDSLTEDGVRRALAKVNLELQKLGPVFEENGLPVYQAVLQLEREALVRRSTLLCICDRPKGATIGEIADSLQEQPSAVADAARFLAAKGQVRRLAGTDDAFVAIEGSLPVYRELLNEFLDSPDDLSFLGTEYAKAANATIVVPFLCNEYSAYYPPDELALVTQVLGCSPSALRLSLMSASPGMAPSILSRRVILDQLLLAGVMADLYARPSIAEKIDIGRVVADLGRSVASRVAPFAQIVARAWSCRDQDIDEITARLSGDSDELPEGLFPVRASLEVEFPADPAFLSFPRVLLAATEEGVPLEIAAPQLKAFQSSLAGEPDASGEEPGKLEHMVFQPQPRSPALPLPQLSARITVDIEGAKARIETRELGVFDQAQFPARLAIVSIDRFPSLDARLVTSCDTSTSRALREQLALDLAISEHGHCELEIIDFETGRSVGTMKAPASASEPDPVLREQVRAVDILAQAEDKWSIAIPAPIFATDHQVKELIRRRDELTAVDLQTCEAALQEISSLSPSSWARVRLTVQDENGNTISDCYPAALPQSLRLTANLKDGETVDYSAQVCQEGLDCRIWSALEPRTVIERFLEGVSSGAIRTPDQAPQGEPVLSEINFSVSPLRKTLWGEEQLIHVTVRTHPVHRRLLDTALKAVADKDYRRAEEVIINVILQEPTSALAHYNLGVARFYLKNLHVAEKSLQLCLNLLSDDDDPEIATKAHAMLAAVRVRFNDLRGAFAELERAAGGPVDSDLSWLLGLLPASPPPEFASTTRFVAGWLLSRVNGRNLEAMEALQAFLAAEDPRHAQFRPSAEALLEKLAKQT